MTQIIQDYSLVLGVVLHSHYLIPFFPCRLYLTGSWLESAAGLITGLELKTAPKSFEQDHRLLTTEHWTRGLNEHQQGHNRGFTRSDDSATSSTIQADGRIVTAAPAFPGLIFAAVRYDADGSLDQLGCGEGDSQCYLVWRLPPRFPDTGPNEKIVVAGSLLASRSGFALVRLPDAIVRWSASLGTGQSDNDFIMGPQDFASSVGGTRLTARSRRAGLMVATSDTDFALARYRRRRLRSAREPWGAGDRGDRFQSF